MQGCGAKTDARPSSPAAIAVSTHTSPPAELLRCPERPEGFTADAWAVMPDSVREAVIRLAKAFGANAERQERLIAWERPAGCIPAPSSSSR